MDKTSYYILGKTIPVGRTEIIRERILSDLASIDYRRGFNIFVDDVEVECTSVLNREFGIHKVEVKPSHTGKA